MRTSSSDERNSVARRLSTDNFVSGPKRVYDDRDDDAEVAVLSLSSSAKRVKLDKHDDGLSPVLRTISPFNSPNKQQQKDDGENAGGEDNASTGDDDESCSSESSDCLFEEGAVEDDDVEKDNDHLVILGTANDLIKSAREQARCEFEQTRQMVMDRLPTSHKALFGEMGFAVGRLRSRPSQQPALVNRQHENDSVCWPARVLSPYQIAPGALRDFWLSKFVEASKSEEQKVPPLLVYLYGMDDGTGSYRVMPFENFCPFPQATHRMQEAALDFTGIGSSLCELDYRRLQAQGDFLLDLKLARNERRRGLMIFQETHEILSLQDLHMA
mmetsp:Transcript_2086/g.4571  ORF Transcript_2086/g.4571 Transcript_2086/m.4571 type:complete len:328 (+) Transcript_2086:110-1093(+)